MVRLIVYSADIIGDTDKVSIKTYDISTLVVGTVTANSLVSNRVNNLNKYFYQWR